MSHINPQPQNPMNGAPEICSAIEAKWAWPKQLSHNPMRNNVLKSQFTGAFLQLKRAGRSLENLSADFIVKNGVHNVQIVALLR